MATLLSCSHPDPAPTYTSMLGTWHFNHDNVGATFSLSEGNSGLIVVEASGSFTIDGVNYPINGSVEFQDSVRDNHYIDAFWLDHNIITTMYGLAPGSQIVFDSVVVNKSYTQMVAKWWSYDQGGFFTNPPSFSVVITR